MKSDLIIQLFENWKKKEQFKEVGERGQFVPDGIVDENIFEKQSKKILFVLRDAHDVDKKYEERGICDEVLHSNNSGKTWYPIAVWARGLLYRKESYASIEELKKEDRLEEDEIDGLRKYF